MSDTPVSKFPAIKATLKSGEEPFKLNGQLRNFSVKDFWRWSTSDLISNATRGVLAEFIVASALGLDLKSVRTEWDDVDLETSDAVPLKIEVKSASYFQSWDQNKPSAITFGIRQRRADIYIFALLHRDKEKQFLDPTELSEWRFYVLNRTALDGYKRSKSSITLKSLSEVCEKLGQDNPLAFDELAAAVQRLGRGNGPD